MAGGDRHSTPPKAFGWQESTPGLVFIIVFNLLGSLIFGAMAYAGRSVVGYVFTVVFGLLAIAQSIKLFNKLAKR